MQTIVVFGTNKSLAIRRVNANMVSRQSGGSAVKVNVYEWNYYGY